MSADEWQVSMASPGSETMECRTTDNKGRKANGAGDVIVPAKVGNSAEGKDVT